MIKEVGPLRIWTYENEVTGPVLLHAARRSRTLKQFAETPPQTLHAPSILENISDGKSRKGLLENEQKDGKFVGQMKGSSWSIAEKYNTPADLVWNWNLEDGKWHVDDELELKCKLIGTTTNKDKDGQVVTDKFPNTGCYGPRKNSVIG